MTDKVEASGAPFNKSQALEAMGKVVQASGFAIVSATDAEELQRRRIEDSTITAQLQAERDELVGALREVKEDLAMCVAEMSRARGRLETIATCNEDRRIAAALGSTCDHVRRHFTKIGDAK